MLDRQTITGHSYGDTAETLLFTYTGIHRKDRTQMIYASPDDKIYPVAKIAAVVNALRAEGITVVNALRGIELSEAELRSPDTRVSLKQVVQCYRRAERLSEDRYFAYRTGLRLHVSTYGMYGFAILSSPSFRQAARFAEHYHQLETPVANIAFREESNHGIWTITPAPLQEVDSALYRFIVELQFGTALSLHRDVMGPSFVPLELHVTYDPIQVRENAEKMFGCPLVFSQPENRLVFDRTWLDRSPELGNELSFLESVRLCDRLLQDMDVRVGIAGSVREILLHNLARNLTIDAVSKRLKMPVRTLKRRLQKHGTSYRQIADELRAQIAMKYLRETDLTVEDIAGCLGYSEAANFRQAFRRWTKATPQQFRSKVETGRAS